MIQTLNAPVQELIRDLNNIYLKDKKSQDIINLPQKSITEIKNIFSDSTIGHTLKNILDPDYINSINYDSLNNMYDVIDELNRALQKIKDEIDIDIFFEKGYNLDIEALRKQFKKKKLKDLVPDLDFDKLKELYRDPPQNLKTYDSEDKIHIDSFLFRKYLIAIIQMVFNHMDILVCATGPEGSGKSLKISQDMYLCWWIMTELKIINYPFDIKEIWFNTLYKFRETEDKYFDHPFRILGLDEGNELNRQDWKDEEVKTFFQRLRRERYNRRLKFVCLPVLGEMIPNIVISRMNFIFEMIQKNQVTTGTLFKGEYNVYIIPRGNKIYSPYLKKELSRTFITSKLFENFKDKQYLKGLPTDIIVKKCYCDGVWAWKEKIYERELKESNKTYTVSKGITISMMESFMFFKSNPSCKKLGVKHDDIRWPSLNKMINRINHKWLEDIDTFNKYEVMFQRKMSEKEEEKEREEETDL